MSTTRKPTIPGRALASGAADCAEQLYALEQLAEAFDPTSELVRAVAHGLIEFRAGFLKLDPKQQKRVSRLRRYVRRHTVALTMSQAEAQRRRSARTSGESQA